MHSGHTLRAAWILALALLVTVVFWPSAQVYAHEWRDFSNITFTHGWLVLAISVALLVRSRREIAAAPARLSLPALAALVVAVFTWLVCYRASVQDLHITILPAVFWLAVTAAFGIPVGALVAFPVAFFYFAVPSLAQLGPPLQALTVSAMHVLFWLTGPAVQISGDMIEIPNGLFQIQEGCSGLHFMIVGLAVAALHGELRRDAWRVRLVQLGLMACFALIANWLRVYVVIESGYLTDMRSHLVTGGHYWFGWGVFALGLSPVFWVTARGGEPAASPSPSTATATPLTGLSAATVVLIGLPMLSLGLRAMQPPAPLRVAIPARAPWAPVAANAQSVWQPKFPGGDTERRIDYENTTGDIVETYRVAYRTQRQGAKLIGMGTSIAGDGLRVRSQGVVQSSAGTFRESQVVDGEGKRSLIWYRYQMADRDFVKPLPGQLWYGFLATASNPPAGLTAYRAACRAESGCTEVRLVLTDFTLHSSAP